MDQGTTLDIEVFRAGDYGAKGQYDETALDAIAGRYDPARHEAPVTLDHAQTGAAHGWVERVWRVGDRLVARIGRLSGELREALRTGAYRKRSIELYRAFGEEGGPYLKAVAFLGAAAPEVKGLADPVFADSAECVAFHIESPRARAEALRRRLQEGGRWHPQWDAEGMLQAMEAVADTPHFDAFAEAMARVAPLVERGALPRTETAFAEELAGAPAAPASRARHQRAVAFLAQHPDATYAEALISANP